MSYSPPLAARFELGLQAVGQKGPFLLAVLEAEGVQQPVVGTHVDEALARVGHCLVALETVVLVEGVKVRRICPPPPEWSG